MSVNDNNIWIWWCKDNNEVYYVHYKISDVDDDYVIMTSWPSYHRNARYRLRLYFCIEFFNINYKGKANCLMFVFVLEAWVDI